ncbi:hypothetical protein [Rhizobium leguminosarum]|uniref:hypothetical protein n=1 Tax=Rhizobium leguminosarum TaxID=384 RepID=UPI0013BF53D7|nr:hypothetical protein [Rhizobium leguminosarum]NEJ46616.1 hypothetical protein [Rhizobium leguminosarum]NEJ53721.1 hypothetical protein [Rhizobium leguminosarum]
MEYNPPFGSLDPDAPYVDRNVPGAVVGSKVPAAAVEDPQRELVALIGAAGIAPSNADRAQAAKAIQSGKINYAAAGGSANVLTAALTLAPTAYTVGMRVVLLIASANTGAVTLNLNGLGAKAVTKIDGSALMANHLMPGVVVDLVYDGTKFLVMSAQRPATQAEADAGVSDVGYMTPLISAKKKASYMSAFSGSQSIPSGVFTTFTSFGAVATHFQGASTFASGLLTIASGDEGVWYLGFSARQSGLGTAGQATQITVNGVAVTSDGGQTNSGGAVGHSSPSVAVVLNVGDVVAFQVSQTTGGSVTFNSYNLSAARIGAS